MAQRRFDVVFLDAGGVLVHPRSERIVESLTAAGFAVHADLLLEAHYHGMRATDLNRAAPEEFSHYQLAYAAHLGLSGEEQARCVELLAELYAPGVALWDEPLPWARTGLEAIAATGVPIVVVSNADGTVADLLARAGLLQVGPGAGVEVAGIIDSGAVGVAKPDPKIFELALEVVGVDPSRAVHVGDAYEYDVRGARAAGVHPVLVDPFGLAGDADCDRIASLVELTDLLA